MIKIEPIINVPYLSNSAQPIEIRPSFRTVFFQEGRDIIKRQLAFPYMQFFLYEGLPKISWSMRSLSSLKDNVSIPLLPNIDVEGVICLGCDAKYTTSIDVCNQFWQSKFTPYEMQAYCDCKRDEEFIGNISDANLSKTILRSFNHWEKLSKKAIHPLDVFSEFRDYTFKFRDFTSYQLPWNKNKKRKRL